MSNQQNSLISIFMPTKSSFCDTKNHHHQNNNNNDSCSSGSILPSPVASFGNRNFNHRPSQESLSSFSSLNNSDNVNAYRLQQQQKSEHEQSFLALIEARNSTSQQLQNHHDDGNHARSPNNSKNNFIFSTTSNPSGGEISGSNGLENETNQNADSNSNTTNSDTKNHMNVGNGGDESTASSSTPNLMLSPLPPSVVAGGGGGSGAVVYVAGLTPNSKGCYVDAGRLKTRLCRNHTVQRPCPFGERCVFAHSESELRSEEHQLHNNNNNNNGGGADSDDEATRKKKIQENIAAILQKQEVCLSEHHRKAARQHALTNHVKEYRPNNYKEVQPQYMSQEEVRALFYRQQQQQQKEEELDRATALANDEQSNCGDDSDLQSNCDVFACSTTSASVKAPFMGKNKYLPPGTTTTSNGVRIPIDRSSESILLETCHSRGHAYQQQQYLLHLRHEEMKRQKRRENPSNSSSSGSDRQQQEILGNAQNLEGVNNNKNSSSNNNNNNNFNVNGVSFHYNDDGSFRSIDAVGNCCHFNKDGSLCQLLPPVSVPQQVTMKEEIVEKPQVQQQQGRFMWNPYHPKNQRVFVSSSPIRKQ